MWNRDNSKSDCRHDGRDEFLGPCLVSSLQRMRGGLKAMSLWPAAYIGYRHYGSNMNK